MFEFDFTVSEKDYIEFNRYHAQKSPAGKKSRRFAMMFVPAVFLIMIAVDYINGETDLMVPMLIVLGVLGVVMLLLSGPLMRWNATLSTKLMKKNGRLPYDSQVKLRFDDESIIEKTPMTEVKTSYAKLERIAVGPSGVYLYNSAISAILIPNTAFTNAAQKYDFLQFMHQKTNLTISDMLS